MLNKKMKALPSLITLISILAIASCSLQQHLDTTPPAQASIKKETAIDKAVIDKTEIDNIASSNSTIFDDNSENATITEDETEDVWSRLRNNLSFDLEMDNDAVAVQRDWYASHPEYFLRITKKARPHLFHVANSLEARDMPAEIALLPIIESAYDPFADSQGRASGMWQFLPATGKLFGLQQDLWYDGRRDVVKSTEAALDYLSYLHERLEGDWLLALAAYNLGEGNINNAIEKNRQQGKPTDFWSLDLPNGAKDYVPKMIALAQILSQPERYGVELPTIPNQPYFESVDVGSQIDMAEAADMAEISLDELSLLNPAFNQNATSPNGPHILNVPVEKVNVFKDNLAGLPPGKRINWMRYKTKSGDSVRVIASRYRTTPKVLRKANDLGTNTISPGEILFVPAVHKGTQKNIFSVAERLEKKQPAASSNSTKEIHITQPGDSFWKVARMYGVTTHDLARWNNLGTSDILRVGQKLVIWNKPVKSDDKSRKVAYKIQSGDSLASIANKFKVKISDIEAWNGINRKKYLQPGQTLKLYVPITQASL